MVHPLGNTMLRTPETYGKYSNRPPQDNTKEHDCFICTKQTEQRTPYRHWRIIDNDFPYDAVAEKHHMLVPRRHIDHSWSLRKDELAELDYIKKHMNEEGEYDAVIENLSRGRTFIPHYHLHLLQWKRV